MKYSTLSFNYPDLITDVKSPAVLRLDYEQKKPAQRSGKKVGNQDCNEKKVHLIVRATDLPGSIHFCRYVL